MDTEIQVFTNDIVKITIDCSRTPITLNHSDIDKLTNTYEQLCHISITIPLMFLH
jgi:hypothetical protein